MGNFIQGMAISDMAHGIEKTAMSTTHRVQMEAATDDFLESQREYSELLSERVALRSALAKLDANHPLLVDDDLSRSIRKAGRAKYNESRTHSWTVIASAGEAIPYDYTPPGQDERTQALILKLEESNVQTFAELEAMRHELGKLKPRHEYLHPEGNQNSLIRSLTEAALDVWRTTHDFSEISKTARGYLNSEGVDEKLSQGTCPNCGLTISLSADECPKCRAMFGAGSAWEIKPIV